MSEDLFGNEVDDHTPPARPQRRATNDMDTVMTVLDRASGENGYLISGRSRRVFRRVDKESMKPVPMWEAHVVHQLVDSGQLKTGGAHHMRCGAVRGSATSVLVPKATRSQVLRWKALARPSTWNRAKGS